VLLTRFASALTPGALAGAGLWPDRRRRDAADRIERLARALLDRVAALRDTAP
jgi:hypothetical protein